MDSMVSGKKSHSEDAKEELYDLIEADSDLRQIMQAYGANRDTLKHVYSKLCLSGAGQWMRGAYVPAAALATNPTLDFVLQENSDNSKFDEHNKWLYISSELIGYFESGRIGKVD